MYYKFIPTMVDCNTYIGDKSILNTKFKSLKDGLEAAKLEGIVLREMNWKIYECTNFGLTKKRIMLKSLYNLGLLSQEIDEDDISKIYKCK